MTQKRVRLLFLVTECHVNLLAVSEVVVEPVVAHEHILRGGVVTLPDADLV